eukprot:TRINITY_DN275_c0_g1_i14.p1 TRINITY_DN275_c0_g1~~TRINITY_DN275_c0_g1_i14.p1  ORF type:complete len:231 (+),score=-2.58 TRINITY_DN275_c0_g1_i14:1262-1954(+)
MGEIVGVTYRVTMITCTVNVLCYFTFQVSYLLCAFVSFATPNSTKDQNQQSLWNHFQCFEQNLIDRIYQHCQLWNWQFLKYEKQSFLCPWIVSLQLSYLLLVYSKCCLLILILIQICVGKFIVLWNSFELEIIVIIFEGYRLKKNIYINIYIFIIEFVVFKYMCQFVINNILQVVTKSYYQSSSSFCPLCVVLAIPIFEQWPDFGCEGIKVQRAHQPTSQCQGKKKKRQL